MNFTIYTPQFNQRGGVIAMYNLCRLLNESGHESAIWTSNRKLNGSIKNKAGHVYRSNKQRCFSRFRHPLYRELVSQPLASRQFVKRSIVVYPEIVIDNPLNSQRVARWILKTPSPEFLEKFSIRDRNVYYWREKFLGEAAQGITSRRLFTPYYPLHLMPYTGRVRTRKYCFIRHKNKTTQAVALDDSAVCLDGMPKANISFLMT